MNKKLRTAQIMAHQAHRFQKDKCGEPYIHHPMRVANSLDNPDLKIIAWLHDTVEDSDMTIDKINDIFGINIALAVEILTHDKPVPYMEYIEKISGNPLAKTVKIADLQDNLDPNRQFEGRDDTKYTEALAYLLNK